VNPVSRVTVETPAKVNLCLAVGPVRPDGFHPLATVYQAIGLFDRLTAVPADDGQVVLDVCADEAGDLVRASDVPTDESNLAVRAARLLAEHTGTAAGVRLGLHKGIPVAGGLAGGSSDAAAALVACNHLWQTGLSRTELLGLAARLGSDVPFCLLGGTALGSGRGEQVSPLPTRGEYHFAVVVDDRGLSTPDVYAELDRLRKEEGDGGADPSGPDVPQPLLDALRAGDAAALGRAMANDLQAAALSLRPELSGLLDRASALGAHGALVSGSGPTCLFLAGDQAHARRMCETLAADGYRAVPASGPAPGAEAVAR
jgi:4-diphosphocytidyl-2-C-methyl-D-erythritol kinase